MKNWRFKKQHLIESIAVGFMLVSFFIVVGSLISILGTILLKGLPALTWSMITQTPKGGYYLGKGRRHPECHHGVTAAGSGWDLDRSVDQPASYALYGNLYQKVYLGKVHPSGFGCALGDTLNCIWCGGFHPDVEFWFAGFAVRRRYCAGLVGVSHPDPLHR